MRKFLLALSPLVCAIAAPVSLDTLIDNARSAPAEFAADALIRIAAIEQVPKARKIELLSDAFDRAVGAQLPFKRHSALSRPDGQAGYWNRVYGQDLDVASLRVRAVAAMLPLDAAKAREMFLRTPPAKLPHATCDDFLIFDPSQFYQALGALARAGDAAPLLERYAGAITSPVEAAPMAAVLAEAQLSDPEFEKILAAFTKALSRIGGDDRSFATSYMVGGQVEKLVAEAKRRHLSPMLLLEAYRVYLVLNLSAARCADDDTMLGGPTSFGMFNAQPLGEQGQDVVSFFNAKLVMAPLQKIQEQEATPARLEGAATGLRICQDVACQGALLKVRELMVNEAGMPYPPAERTKPEWKAKFRAVLKGLDAWKLQPGVTPSEFYEEKSEAYRGLFNIAAPGEERDAVAHALLDFAAGSDFQKAGRAEWFLPVNAVIARFSLDAAGFSKLAEETRNSKHPVIALYANLEAAAPRPADKVLPLM